jgi:hypothetical protein
VQHFLGLVQYLAHFMPNVSAYTGPLAAIQKNGHPFHWRPLHQKCMDNIKILACKTLILQQVDPRSGEPIYLEGSEAVAVVCCCLAGSVDSLSRFVLFPNPFHPWVLAFCTSEPSQTASAAPPCGDAGAIQHLAFLGSFQV